MGVIPELSDGDFYAKRDICSQRREKGGNVLCAHISFSASTYTCSTYSIQLHTKGMSLLLPHFLHHQDLVLLEERGTHVGLSLSLSLLLSLALSLPREKQEANAAF